MVVVQLGAWNPTEGHFIPKQSFKNLKPGQPGWYEKDSATSIMADSDDQYLILEGNSKFSALKVL